MNSGDRHAGPNIDRDHPQTRKREDDARGSAGWNDDVRSEPVRDGRHDRDLRERRPVTKPAHDEKSDRPTVAELAEQAAAVRSQAVGARTGGDATGNGSDRDSPD